MRQSWKLGRPLELSWESWPQLSISLRLLDWGTLSSMEKLVEVEEWVGWGGSTVKSPRGKSQIAREHTVAICLPGNTATVT